MVSYPRRTSSRCRARSATSSASMAGILPGRLRSGHTLTARAVAAVAGWLLLRARWLGGLGRLGEPGVQPFPDLVRSVGTAAPFGARDHYTGGGDPCEAG